MKTLRHLMPVALVVLMLGTLVAPIRADSHSLRAAADAMHDQLVAAQRLLFRAERAADPQAVYDEAGQAVSAAQTLYHDALQPPLLAQAPLADGPITSALDEAAAAVAAGDPVALAAASGHLWSGLLYAGYAGTLSAITAGDLAAATDWLGVREFIPATRITLITNDAAQAVAALGRDEVDSAAALTAIQNDLLNTYFFRLRDALQELQIALDREFAIRAAEWAGEVSGYYRILADDFTAKMGDEAAAALQADLSALEAAVRAADWPGAYAHLDAVRAHVSEYQPVELSAEEIAENGQLLYVFTDLVAVEYRDGVRNGAITVEIEYREAVTFHTQAVRLYEVLRPIIAATDADAAQRLGALYDTIGAQIASYADSSAVTEGVQEAKQIIEAALSLNLGNSNAAAFVIVETLLSDIENAVAVGRYEDAEQSRLQAYAIFDFGPEKRLLTFAPELAFTVETLFWQGDDTHPGLGSLLAVEAPPEEITPALAGIRSVLAEAQVVLGTSTAPLTIIVNSAIIVLREGLEAVVIIVALSAGLVRAKMRLRGPLLLGALLAFVATLITGIIANRLLSLFQSHGEKLEAVVSLIAIGVLLLITNWFFHKVYWADHLAGFHKQKHEIIKGAGAGQFLALVLLGFTSIYREGFETVLFLQALILDAGVTTVLQGTLLGLLLVAIVGGLTFMLQKRLPYMAMMVVTGILIGGVLIIMIGKTARVLQVVGWLPITPVTGLSLPYWLGQWFGVFATWEGLLLQVMAAVFVVGSYYLAEYQKKSRRSRRKQAAQPVAPSQNS
ncbi:MAG: FTR1 family protein [Anaerolineae bacterium]|nr:FTR1 family protein [Anaerolineae bacterium]